MKIFFAVSLVLVGIIAFALWTKKPTESVQQTFEEDATFLVGTWIGGSGGGEDGALGSTKTLEFTPGRFILDGYPALHQEGLYEVVGASDTRFSVRLLDQTGDLPTADRVADIQIVDKNTIVFDNETYSRRQ